MVLTQKGKFLSCLLVADYSCPVPTNQNHTIRSWCAASISLFTWTFEWQLSGVFTYRRFQLFWLYTVESQSRQAIVVKDAQTRGHDPVYGTTPASYYTATNTGNTQTSRSQDGQANPVDSKRSAIHFNKLHRAGSFSASEKNYCVQNSLPLFPLLSQINSINPVDNHPILFL